MTEDVKLTPGEGPKPGGSWRSSAILLFLQTREPADLAPVIDALRRAVSRDPAFGLAWTQLARLHAVNCAFEVVPIETPIEDAVILAERGVSLEPTSPGAGRSSLRPCSLRGRSRRLGSRRSGRASSARRHSCTSACWVGY